MILRILKPCYFVFIFVEKNIFHSKRTSIKNQMHSSYFWTHPFEIRPTYLLWKIWLNSDRFTLNLWWVSVWYQGQSGSSSKCWIALYRKFGSWSQGCPHQDGLTIELPGCLVLLLSQLVLVEMGELKSVFENELYFIFCSYKIMEEQKIKSQFWLFAEFTFFLYFNGSYICILIKWGLIKGKKFGLISCTKLMKILRDNKINNHFLERFVRKNILTRFQEQRRKTN